MLLVPVTSALRSRKCRPREGRKRLLRVEMTPARDRVSNGTREVEQFQLPHVHLRVDPAPTNGTDRKNMPAWAS